jgi:DNA-binding NarL/FixJ family response regulator
VIRVLLADDEAVVRAGIRTVLASDPQLRVVAEASNGRQAVELACLHTPDLAVVDIRMPVLDGLSATAELRARVPETGVLLLTTFGEDDYIARGLEHGANGFVLKASDPQPCSLGFERWPLAAHICLPKWPCASSRACAMAGAHAGAQRGTVSRCCRRASARFWP